LKSNLYLISLLFFSLTLTQCSRKNVKINTPTTKSTPKINGVSLVAVNYAIDTTHLSAVKDINATWITAIPFGFITSKSSEVQYNTTRQWYGEKKQGTIETIKYAHQKGIKVMVKPHLWIWDIWVGDLDFNPENDWLNFEKTYTKYILDYAKLSDSMAAESFCIGVELKQVVKKRPQFWMNLIEKVRTVYSGKITYAANWDNYQNVQFWSKLDYIGIDAYFPVSDEKTPTLQTCLNGWNTDFNRIRKLSIAVNKKVIFTEFGYRNVDYSGKEPWDDKHLVTYNSIAQENTYKALFTKFWKETWFGGGFLWKWYPNHNNAGGLKNNRFTPQNKPVQNLIKTIYSQTK
jgi:hypothetical protein